MNETTRQMQEKQEQVAKQQAQERHERSYKSVNVAQDWGAPVPFPGATCANEAGPGISLTPQIVRDCRQRQRELVAQRDRIENSLRIVQELLNVWES